jgi:uncharacterized protein (DUF697 family)
MLGDIVRFIVRRYQSTYHVPQSTGGALVTTAPVHTVIAVLATVGMVGATVRVRRRNLILLVSSLVGGAILTPLVVSAVFQTVS